MPHPVDHSSIIASELDELRKGWATVKKITLMWWEGRT
jgi:hypothetical protein